MLKGKKTLSRLVFLLRYSWGISKRLFAASAISIVLDTVEPFVLLILPKFIIDELTGLKRWDIVLHYILLLIGVTALIRAVRLLFSVFINMSVNRADMLTGIHYSRFFLSMDYEKLEDGSIRDAQQKVSQNVRPNALIYEDLRGLLTSLFRLLGYSYLIFSLHPLVLLLVAAVVAANYVLSLRREKNQYEFQKNIASNTRKFDYLFHTMIDFRFAKEVRINRVSRWLSGKFEEVLSQYAGSYAGFQRRQWLYSAVASLIGFCQTVVMYGYAALQAVRGAISIGDFSVYLGAIFNFSGSFVDLFARLSHLLYLSKYAEDYQSYTALARPAHLDKGVIRLPEKESRHEFEFRHVNFRYPHTEKLVLSDICLTIGTGEKLSIVGMNGAGKTTLIKLLCRLYEPTEGVILYNGTDISTIRHEDYTRLLSVVFQDFQLFSFSVAENVVLSGKKDPEKVLDALRKGGLEDKLSTLPHGVDTAVNKEFEEDGVEFSGGEGQKLVTARAYYKDAPVVILDEPTAALDPLSENEVYMRFHEIMQGKTAIFISHRLASTRFCDRIAVFADGRIIEYGTHDQLMASGGLYNEMFSKQAEYYKNKEASV